MKVIGYRGPDVGVDWTGRNGFPCTCEWSTGYGDVCPEHGAVGVPIYDPVAVVTAERDAARERAARFETIIRTAQNYLAGEPAAISPAPSLDWYLATELYRITGEPVC